MKVCIGITTKNRAIILPKAIQSALEQSFPHKEIIVFDDGSTDNIADVKEQFPQVIWLRTEKSIGLMEARNTMMKACNSDYFVSLDDDAWFLSNDEISHAVDIMEKDRSIAAIAFDILQNNTQRVKPYQRSAPVLTNIFIGCGHILRLSAVKEAGYYIPLPGKYGHEEKDLSMCLLDLSYKIYFLPGVHVWHDKTELARHIPSQEISYVCNDLIFKYRRVPIIFILPVLLHNIYKKIKSSEYKTENSIRGILHFFKSIPSQSKYVKRVRAKTYIDYRKISKSYLSYRAKTAQN